VFLGVERVGQPFVLPGREQLGAGSGDAADAVERISGMAAPPQGLLLDALADQVELDPGQRDDVEGIHHRDRIRVGKSRHYPSADCGIVAEMDARWDPGLDDPFEEAIDEALESLPANFRAAMSNVAIVVEDEPPYEPPDARPLLGLYRGVRLPGRGWRSSGMLPAKVSIFRGPITRLAAGDADRLRREVRHVVLHELAHYFGIK
jgi:predicted Zn-dependent protease with MMP-like domain